MSAGADGGAESSGSVGGMSPPREQVSVLRAVARWGLAALLAAAGASHLTLGRRGYRIVVPDWAVKLTTLYKDAIVVRQQPELRVGQRGGLLHRGVRLDERGELAQRHARDREVLERAQRLHAVERLVLHLALAEEVVLEPRAMSAEPQRASTSHERRVGTAESRGPIASGKPTDGLTV